MRGKNARKYKRYQTEPQEFPSQNYTRLTNLTLKELKLQVAGMDMLNDIPPPLRADRNANKFIPLQARLQLKRNALKRLPELTNAPQFINAKEQSSLAQKHSLAQNPALFKASNPLFVVNTLFEIMKEDISIPDGLSNKEQKQQRRVDSNTIAKKHPQNEFNDPSAKSVKVHRPPRIVDNELARLAQQSTFSRRKICSQQKSRPRVEKEVELLTFYKPQMREEREHNQFL